GLRGGGPRRTRLTLRGGLRGSRLRRGLRGLLELRGHLRGVRLRLRLRLRLRGGRSGGSQGSGQSGEGRGSGRSGLRRLLVAEEVPGRAVARAELRLEQLPAP